MNSESIMNSDVLDIVFEKRNKLYGAYILRKFYNNRLIKSMSITLGAVTFLSAFTFIPQRKGKIIFTDDYVMAKLANPKTPATKKALPRAVKPVLSTQKKWLVPLVVKEKPDTMQEISPTDRTGATNATVPANNIPAIISEPFTGAGNGGDERPLAVLPDKNQPVDNPDVQPVFPGGITALKTFLERNLVNPVEMEPGEMVAVNVKFVVGFDGKLRQFTVVKDGGDIFNREVIRVLKKMPQWIPGKSKGENVAVDFIIPIKFVPAD